MKKITAFTFITFLAFATSSFVAVESPNDEVEEGLVWYTDLDEVHALSEESGKPVFGFFTGSDWCGWCHKLQRDVFAKQAFIDWAKEEVILFEIDFPRKKVLPAELKQQNDDLRQAFQVTGYPTVWIFNTEKVEEKYNLSALGKLGYQADANAFVKDANAILATNK